MQSTRTQLKLAALVATVSLVVSAAYSAEKSFDRDTFFELKIRPVLAGTCFNCHGGEKVNHGLRVDSREALVKGGDSGPAIIPGEPDKSLLIQAVRHTHDEIKMAPKKRLAAEVVADFATWIKDGAPWPETKGGLAFPRKRHWAFEPVTRIDPPAKRNGWSDHPIDRFVMATLQDHGMNPVGPAGKRALIRRLCFDVIGLPPSPEEVEAFETDRSPDAYARLVERLLASPRYGERWGRHWLDVVRYADTAGDNADYPIPEARRYRDYVIDSLNADKPYDQFVREQIAGDLLAKSGPREEYAARVVATGFIALSRRYATAPFELMHLTVEDTIETTGRAFLGLTLRCARCHDHKYDPVTKEDYYALYGFFASTQYPYAGSEEFQSKNFNRSGFQPIVPPEESTACLEAFRKQVDSAESELKHTEQEDLLAGRIAELKKQVEVKSNEIKAAEESNQNTDALRQELASLTKQRDEASKQLEAKLKPVREQLRNLQRAGLPSGVPGAYAVCDATPVDAFVHVRGEPGDKGPVIRRGVPKFLSSGAELNIPDGASGRLGLGQWLTRPENPLTARVMVNRIWQHHFGKGIVATPSNFGLRGEPPTHPELLDYLAARFVESGWSIKAIHRLILLSKTYQLSSAHNDADAARDPGNKLYWRFDRRRLDAESIRDTMLSVAGNLDLSRPAEHPFPKIDDWHWTQHNPFKAVYESNHRGVYLMTQRIQRHPYLALFDAPDANTSTDVRSESTVPLQALYLMNNPFVQNQAAALARRLLAATNDVTQGVRLGTELTWSRPPRGNEVEKAVQFVNQYRQALGETVVAADKVELEAWTSYARVLLTANEFFYVD